MVRVRLETLADAIEARETLRRLSLNTAASIGLSLLRGHGVLPFRHGVQPPDVSESNHGAGRLRGLPPYIFNCQGTTVAVVAYFHLADIDLGNDFSALRFREPVDIDMAKVPGTGRLSFDTGIIG